MGLFDGWPFKSKEQAAREAQEFEQRVFPFGEGQREAARKLLRQVVSPRLRDTEMLFAFISAKEAYVKDGRSAESLKAARSRLEKQGWANGRDLDLIFALVRLDAMAEGLESYPAAGDVLRLCGESKTAGQQE